MSWKTINREDPQYASLAVCWRQEEDRQRKVYVVEGLAPGERTLATNDRDVMTTCTAILERMIYAKINGVLVKRQCKSYHYYREKLDLFKYKLIRAVGRTIAPYSPEEFVETYKGRKRTLYENALEDYVESQISAFDARLRTFMKVEKVPFNKSPRGIQPRSPHYNIALGRYIKRMEKPIFKAIAKVFKQDIVVFKGMNVEEQGQAAAKISRKYKNPVYVGIDASRFDASVDKGLLEWEHTIYTNLNRDPILKRLLRYQTWNVGTAYCPDGVVRYKMSGGRGSGDMNTSLGNCIIMCAIVFMWMMQCAVRFDLMNNGDDCLCVMESEDLDQFRTGLPDYALSLGFRLTTEEPVYTLEEAEFCQMHAIEVEPDNWRFVRNSKTAREKDTMCLMPLTDEVTTRKWMYAVGECGLALCSGVPIMQEFYKAFMREGIDSSFKNAPYFQSSFIYTGRGMESKERIITDHARASYFVAWGITPDEQVAMEEYYMNWKFDFKLNDGDITTIPVTPY
nr:MAG: RNA-dependent RNA polymerase [Riboviria sp.]